MTSASRAVSYQLLLQQLYEMGLKTFVWWHNDMPLLYIEIRSYLHCTCTCRYKWSIYFKNLNFFFLNLSFSFVLQFVPGSGTWPPEQRWARWVGILWTQHGQGQTDLPGESRSNVRFQELLPYAPKQDHRACSSKCALDLNQNIYTVYNTINLF